MSRTTILSGLTGRSYGTPGKHDQARPEAVETLYPDLLRERGYRTGYFGKWHAKMPMGYVIVAPDGQAWVVGKMPLKEFAPGEWHEYRVLVRGNHHQHWIDGHPTADLIDLDAKGRALEGVLAMQVHVGPAMRIQYRDFRIKHLPDDLPLQTAEQHPIPADAYGVRPQGRLPKDWKAPIYGEMKR